MTRSRPPGESGDPVIGKANASPRRRQEQEFPKEHENVLLMSLRLRLRSSLRQCGVSLMLRLPRAYPSARKARLGTHLG